MYYIYYTVTYPLSRFQCPKYLVRISTSSCARSEGCGAGASLMSMS